MPFPENVHPLIQAPMVGQDSALTIAVAQAGGIGSLACATLSADALRSEAAAIRHALPAGTPYNLNFFCHTPEEASHAQLQAWRTRLQPYYTELGVHHAHGGASRQPFDQAIAELLETIRPPIVSFHFGLPEPALLQRVRQLGCQIWSSATTVAEALWLAHHGVDAVIAQGLEAGGHRGHFLSDDLPLQMGTFALLPQVVQALQPLNVAVIAAGGIASAQAVQAALALGATAVQVGTAFLCADEALTTPVHRAALQSPQAMHTALTTLFTGRPARGIVNRAMHELGCFPAEAPPFPHASAALAPLRTAAEARGQGDFSPLWSGQNASGCRSASAAAITRWLMGWPEQSQVGVAVQTPQMHTPIAGASLAAST